MTGVSYFEIGGEIIECTLDYDVATGISQSEERNVQAEVMSESRTDIHPARVVEPVTLAYSPYSYGNPLVWAATQVLMRIAQRRQQPGVDPITGQPNVY